MKMLQYLLLSLFGYISCSSVAFEDIITANNLFSSDVYKQVLSQVKGKNFIASPFSAEAVLALTQSGAIGETGEEIRKALRLPSSTEKIEKGFKSLLETIKSNDFYSLHSANKIYIDNGISLNSAYEEIARDIYRSEIEKIKFYPNTKEAANTINEWVKKKTNNKIRDLIGSSSLNEDVKMILINALYFKGKWAKKFDRTDQQTFTKFNGETVRTDFIQKTSHYNYYESKELNARFLEIPYSGYDASFVIILPNEKDGLRKLENQTAEIFLKPKFTLTYVDVNMPKFKVETSIQFNEILQNLGMKKAFDSTKADFTGITQNESLYISKVVQKAFVELSETGVEAAAATYVIAFATRSDVEYIGPEPIPFYAVHPFIFYVKVKDIIMFVGRIVEFT